MGRFDPSRLADWHRDQGPALVDPDRSVLIGRHRKIESVDATLIHTDEKGRVVYGKEVELQSIKGCPLELPAEVEKMLGIRLLTGWLIFTEAMKYQNYYLMVTEFPTR